MVNAFIPLCKVSVRIQMPGALFSTDLLINCSAISSFESEGGGWSCAWHSSLLDCTDTEAGVWCSPATSKIKSSIFFCNLKLKTQINKPLSPPWATTKEHRPKSLCYLFFPFFPTAIFLKIQSSSSSLIARFETIQNSRSPVCLKVLKLLWCFCSINAQKHILKNLSRLCLFICKELDINKLAAKSETFA